MPADLEQRLRTAAPSPTRPLDLDATIAAGLRARRRRTILRAVCGSVTGVVVIVGVVVAINVVGGLLVDIDGAGLSPTAPGDFGDNGGVDGDDRSGPDAPADTPAGPDAADPGEPSDDAPSEQGQVAERLAEFDSDVDVEAAVAPYDTASAVDGVFFASLLHLPREVAYSRCIEELGVTDEFPLSLPDRDAIASGFRLDFPDLDHLLQGGLRLEVSEDLQFSSAYEQARTICREQEQPLAEHRAADELYAEVRSAWHEQLEQVDESSEVREAGGRFSACLVAEGVPADQAVDEISFLGYLDGVTMRHEGPLEELDELYADRGRLYAQCARELFEIREQLRSERRPDFLAEHRDAIEQLERWKAETYG